MLYTLSNPAGLGGAPHKLGISSATSHCLGQAGGGQHWEVPMGTILSPSRWAWVYMWPLLKAGEQSHGVAALLAHFNSPSG